MTPFNLVAYSMLLAMVIFAFTNSKLDTSLLIFSFLCFALIMYLTFRHNFKIPKNIRDVFNK